MTSSNRTPARRDRFWKMHGAGNDFVVLDLTDREPPSPGLCRLLADRHTGVGCDLILGVEAPRTPRALASFRIWTAQGRPSRQCGNGARCVALWLRLVRGIRDECFSIDSPSATHAMQMDGDAMVRMSFGRADLRPARRVVVDQQTFGYTPVWIGNPHAVVQVSQVDAVPLERLGTALQDPRSGEDPEVNVGAVELIDAQSFRLRVFEYGAGETQACGSGACAAAEVMMNAGLVGETVDVIQRGGTLTIERHAADAQLFMTGPAAMVYEGLLASTEPL